MKTREQIMEFISRQKVAFVASVDEEGFPTVSYTHLTLPTT